MDFNQLLSSLHGWPAAAVLIALIFAIAVVVIVLIVS